MRVITKPLVGSGVDLGVVIGMRHSGATLEQIASTIGRTKERVRQILVKNYGSTKHSLLSTEQISEILDLHRSQIMKLYKAGIISPVRDWPTSRSCYLLWSIATLEQILAYYATHSQCRVCHRPMPRGRRSYCSAQCCEEGHKYKYKSAEAKKSHLNSVKKYREKYRWLAKSNMDKVLLEKSSKIVENEPTSGCNSAVECLLPKQAACSQSWPNQD